ncbi:hypothetical protein PVK06_002276 [Gossypium arboreum]|uniref:Reverse transcriptase zinc-binding domain-containing protein n=1 Tax=Gossypium arboreum TaxID=29729 RepID=A0ABR0R354_GOSAR|nr:hypothetical protein PVK06_002276 [Gossypium arboreum]
MGMNIKIWNDAWGLGLPTRNLHHTDVNASALLVLDSINPLSRLVYTTLWKLQLPVKVKITFWKIFHNYVPSYSNIYHKCLRASALYPRYLVSNETLEYIFRDFQLVFAIWGSLRITWPSEALIVSLQDWLLSIFTVSAGEVIRKVVCALWFIWHARHRWVHNNNAIKIHVLVRRVQAYLLE